MQHTDHAERRTVSRKTPLDGRLEISEAAARVARAMPAEFALEVDGAAARARLTSVRCGCAKAWTAGAHEHHFLESDALRALGPEQSVVVELRPEEGRAVVRRP